MELQCVCDAPRVCPVHGCFVTARTIEYCRGTSGLPREAEERLLAVAREDAGPKPDPAPAWKKGLAALLAAGRFAAAGRAVPQQVYDARLDVCAGAEGRPRCEHFDAGRGACRLCGCRVALKAALTSEKCPAGKWHD